MNIYHCALRASRAGALVASGSEFRTYDVPARNETEARDIAMRRAYAENLEHVLVFQVKFERELRPAYAGMCLDPTKCDGLGYCPRDPACNN